MRRCRASRSSCPAARDFTSLALSLALCAACSGAPTDGGASAAGGNAGLDLASTPATARSAAGDYISWREHLVDDEQIGGVAIRGGDGLKMADLDLDGYLDIVSVHESDTEYDGVADGHIRIAFGSDDPDVWELTTLAEGEEAGAAEDVAIGDVNGDGYPDVVAACELAHLIYFENPGPAARTARWARTIPAVASGRGSFIRVFLDDLDGDGRLEVIAANKGAQDPASQTLEPKPLSWFRLTGDPLDGDGWREHELARVLWPINAQPVDLDGDGDVDIVGGSVAERRILWFENRGDEAEADADRFVEHDVHIAGTSITGSDRPPAERDTDEALVSGFNMAFVDLSSDGRLDIVTFEAARLVGRTLVWIEQPPGAGDPWPLHLIGRYAPDQVVGLAMADINGDGRPDLMTGGYSLGSRERDEDARPDGALGRLAWFEHPGDPTAVWIRHDISRRARGMFDQFVPIDLDGDGDVDFASTRGNSSRYDGVFWLEQVRTPEPVRSFEQARAVDSPEVPLPRCHEP